MEKKPSYWGLYIGLIATSVFFAVLEVITHIRVLGHIAAVPLEVFLAVFVVERFLARREEAEKRRQLMFIKSYLFRSEMRNLFLTGFEALESPPVTMKRIHDASLEDLQAMREAADHVEFRSPEAMEDLVLEYVKVRDIWINFMNQAIRYGFEPIFHNMIQILHFVSEAGLYKESFPDRLYVEEAAKHPKAKDRMYKILGDGIRSFLDYAIELKETQSDLLEEMMADYDYSARLRADEKAA
ncbi:MAG: hypothetical protein ACC662_01210 [Planctomycetota bacterium]